MEKVGKVGKWSKTPLRPSELRPPPWRKPLQGDSQLGPPPRLQRHTALVQPADSGKSSSAFTFKVSGCIDQNSRRWVEVISGTNRCRVPLDHFSAAPQEALKKINSAGVLIINEQAKTYLKNQVQAVTQWRQVYIADHRGWHNENKCFVLARDVVLGEEADRQNVEVELDDSSAKWTKRGTHAEWLRAAELMTGQSLAIFLTALTFVSPLLSIVPGFLNIGIELVGPPGIGKSTLAQWCASVWGGDPTRPTGFFELWATTLNGLEPTIRWHAGALLGLDEINLLGSLDDRDVRRLLESAVFRLCYGAEKRRYGDSVQPRSDRLCWLSTSNIRISDALAGAAPDVVEAAAHRLISIPALVSEFGVFDRLAPGFATSSELIAHLKSDGDQNFGTAIRLFLRRLGPARRNYEERLREILEGWIDLFLKRADVNLNHGPTVRAARVFGLIYAAGRLAQRWGVLPATWQIGSAVMQCYRAHLSQRSQPEPARRSAYSHIMDYVRRHRGEFFDLRRGKVDMDDGSFAEAYGFLKPTSDGGLELLVPPGRMHQEFPDYLSLMRELHAQGHARTEGGTQPKLTTKAAVRLKKPLARVYCIRLPS